MDMRGKKGETAQRVRLSCGFMYHGPAKSTQVRTGRAQADPEQLRLVLASLHIDSTVRSTESSSEERSVQRISYLDDADNVRLSRAATGRRRRARVKFDLRCAGVDEETGKTICVCGKAEVTEDIKNRGPESLNDYRPHQPHTVKQIYRQGTAAEGHVWHRQGMSHESDMDELVHEQESTRLAPSRW